MEQSFEVGAVIRESFSLFFRTAKVLVPATLLVQIPSLILNARSQVEQSANDMWFTDPSGVALFLAQIVLGLVLGAISLGAVTAGAAGALRGEAIGVGQVLQAAAPFAFRIIGAMVLIGTATAIAAVFFVVPGIMVAMMLYVTVPVIVVEKVGLLDALGRSRDLTAGRRTRVFGAVFLVALALMIPGMVAYGPYMFVAFTGGGSAAIAVTSSIGFLFSAIAYVFVYTMQLYVYHALRLEREGIGVGEVAGVLD